MFIYIEPGGRCRSAQGTSNYIGDLDIVAGAWNEIYLQQLENFPDSKFKDMIGASSNGSTELKKQSQFNPRDLI